MYGTVTGSFGISLEQRAGILSGYPKSDFDPVFIDQMRKGTYVIEYQVYVNRTGEYQAGIATVQSAYAPEFGGHTGGYRVMVE